MSQARNWSLDKLLPVAEELQERAWEGQATLGELIYTLGELIYTLGELVYTLGELVYTLGELVYRARAL